MLPLVEFPRALPTCVVQQNDGCRFSVGCTRSLCIHPRASVGATVIFSRHSYLSRDVQATAAGWKPGSDKKRLVHCWATTEDEPQVAQEDSRWFFGYGATIHETVLERRGIVALEAYPASIKDYALAFDVGGVGAEAAFASVAPAEGARTHGMLYKFSQEDYLSMLRSENAVPPAEGEEDKRTYFAHPVTAEPYGGEHAAVEAATLCVMPNKVSPEDRRSPSRRYLALICEGARQRGLCSTYIEKLASVPYVANELGASDGVEDAGVDGDSVFYADFTLEDLAQFDGSRDEDSPIYIGFFGRVYDVSESRAVYKPGAAFSANAGKDATNALLKMATVPRSDVDGSLLPLDENGRNELDRQLAESMMNFMAKKYPQVGYLVLENTSSADFADVGAVSRDDEVMIK